MTGLKVDWPEDQKPGTMQSSHMCHGGAMSFIRPALVSLTGVAGLVCMLGCDSGDGIPATPPLAAKEPLDILPHLQYLIGRKDYKHVVLIAPVEEAIVAPSARWFHNQAKQLGIELTPEEIQGLEVQTIADKLDNLPPAPTADYDLSMARKAFNAGLYRLLKGFDANDWKAMRVLSVNQNPANIRIMDVVLGINNQPKMLLALIKKSDGSWGISNVQYKSGLAKKPAPKK